MEKGLDIVQYRIILRRAKDHLSCLEEWEKDPPVLGAHERDKVIAMLGEALEMSR